MTKILKGYLRKILFQGLESSTSFEIIVLCTAFKTKNNCQISEGQKF